MEVVQRTLSSALETLESADRTKLTAAACSLPVALVAFGAARRWIRDRRLPPGPSGLPLLGCVQLNDQSKWHLQLDELGDRYNGLFSFYYGTQLMVVVTSYELMKEMLESPNFAGRHQTPVTAKIAGNTGIGIAEGDVWSLHRRMSLRILRDFGFAKEVSFDMLSTAMETVFAAIDEAIERRQPVTQITNRFLEATNSVIAQLLFGRFFTRDDKEFVKFCDAVASFFKFPLLSVLDKYPVLYHLAAMMMPSSVTGPLTTMRQFVTAAVHEREAAFTDDSQEPTCLCDVYIQEKRKAAKKGDFETFKMEQIIGVCNDFFFAGTDTTARSVEWMVLMMAFYPDVQQKVQKEIDEVVGRNGRLQLSHKSKLDYTNAVIEECYRRASIGGVGVPHRTTEDTEFHGYRIPKDSLLLPHQYSVLRSPKYWDQPEEFRPDRFIDSNGRFRSSSKVIPFLMGKRSCVGEALARMEIFGMFASLLQRYEIRPTPDSLARRDEILTPKLLLTLMPGEYELEFVRRSS